MPFIKYMLSKICIAYSHTPIHSHTDVLPKDTTSETDEVGFWTDTPLVTQQLSYFLSPLILHVILGSANATGCQINMIPITP